MKKIVYALLIAIFAVGTIFTIFTTTTSARAQDDPHYRREHRYKAGESASVWCKKHPHKCAQGSYDTMVSTKFEKCLDEFGNRDGYIEGWEVANFGSKCKNR